MAIAHYENFPVASLLLPRKFHQAVALIYRFAREADDLADEGEAPDAARLASLAGFREQVAKIERGETPDIPWFAALAEVIRRHRLPIEAFADLLSAFAQDITKKRYAVYAEVLDYARRSANPVGRLLLALYGAATTQNLAYSDAVCSSLQIINFLQDIAIDYRKGRLYMPQDELARFGVSEEQIARGDSDENWRAFMAFQIARAREMLLRGAPLGRILAGRVGLEIRMIVQGGDRILSKIAAAEGDVFRHRPILLPHDWPIIFLRAL